MDGIPLTSESWGLRSLSFFLRWRISSNRDEVLAEEPGQGGGGGGGGGAQRGVEVRAGGGGGDIKSIPTVFWDSVRPKEMLTEHRKFIVKSEYNMLNTSVRFVIRGTKSAYLRLERQ